MAGDVRSRMMNTQQQIRPLGDRTYDALMRAQRRLRSLDRAFEHLSEPPRLDPVADAAGDRIRRRARRRDVLDSDMIKDLELVVTGARAVVRRHTRSIENPFFESARGAGAPREVHEIAPEAAPLQRLAEVAEQAREGVHEAIDAVAALRVVSGLMSEN
jgi:hypothetical protein